MSGNKKSTTKKRNKDEEEGDEDDEEDVLTEKPSNLGKRKKQPEKDAEKKGEILKQSIQLLFYNVYKS